MLNLYQNTCIITFFREISNEVQDIFSSDSTQSAPVVTGRQAYYLNLGTNYAFVKWKVNLSSLMQDRRLCISVSQKRKSIY